MTPLVEKAFKLIDAATEQERRAILKYVRRRTAIHPLEEAWGTTAEAILGAISRSSDLTQRGIRGILAEATFEAEVIPQLAPFGWSSEPLRGDLPYDFLLQRDVRRVRVQVKLQRRERGTPKQISKRVHRELRNAPEMLFVVEVQKTRSGSRGGRQTRPYHFGDFDVLAVNLHPSTGVWSQFLYTLGDWLLPRASAPELMEIMQPVPASPDKYWTDDLGKCLDWLSNPPNKRLYS